MKTASKELQALFVELVKIELNNYKRVSKNMVENTIKFYAIMYGFNKFIIEYWYSVASANGIKYSI